MLVPLYFGISMLSAFLLFLVQPMAAKAVLPVLGGAPFVWNGCMLFFQTMLLGGYIYSHHIVKHFAPRKQVLIHLSMLVVALVVFPSAFKGTTWVDAAYHPLAWLMGTLLISIAVPFFALSATAPMIQGWFVHAGHTRSHNPYFLYAASNFGSFGSLIAYLVYVEPNYTRAEQLLLLHIGFAVLVAFFIVAGVILYRSRGGADAVAAAVSHEKSVPNSWKQISYWLALSFVPSSLLYGVTQFITTDVASMPLLWVVPLGLYLLTFVMVFAERPVGVVVSRMLLIPAVSGVLLLTMISEYSIMQMFEHLAAFFIVVMVCHATLSESRPAASQLTAFYLWISLGGVLGGVFNTFVAPVIFQDITEYPLMLFLSVVVCFPWGMLRSTKITFNMVLPALGVAAIFFVLYLLLSYSGWIVPKLHMEIQEFNDSIWVFIYKLWYTLLVVLVCFGSYQYKLVTTSVFVVLVAASALLFNMYSNEASYLFSERNIFGVNRVYYNPSNNANYFRHGTTDHGLQSQDDDKRLAPVSYYTALKMVFELIESDKRTKGKPVGLMGLGVGTVTCYGKKGQEMDIFEIDPLVLKIATNEKYFTYMRDCPPKKNVIIGDARISISKMPDKHYGLLVADAFTSDAVPVHLLTQEAVALYLDKVVDGGAVAIHVTNRHLRLWPVLSTIAKELGAHAYYLSFTPDDGDTLAYYSNWVIVTRDTSLEKRLKGMDSSWEELVKFEPKYLWRDDFSNLLGVVYEFDRFRDLF